MNNHATKRLTILSVLTAISFALTIFPKVAILPAASFLKIDFSIVPAFLALTWYGIGSATLLLIVRTLLKVIIFNEGVNTYIGMPMNFLVAWAFLLAYVIVLALPVIKEQRPVVKQSLALLVAIVFMTLIAIVANIVWGIPLYSSMAHFDIAKFIGIPQYLWGMVLPFNLIEGLVWAVASLAVVKALSPFKKTFQP
ncbi:ECF transporter S component [Fructobacillus fructosus]|uniref:Riboflavin transporter n=1 Tax=Fructobacillus fructosus TaxID=1631 RepID=A0ABN9YK63_9LACO|nr:ECF transporter S component [Fructobacillus fructosus]MBD9364539.1 ECF transporter S component [Leuconostoc mesenteroides]MBC9118318.1 ECF transporter S component [Fructobacillus fructosus]MCK8638036.1 ECF transporter S component [Fructobacillus fructosus]CAK1228342.1 Riboflavin transporter FmnP (FmnP) [Fructobacillus fructosus]CAK1228367.1 Riboflavin transporter FmnP (FmnP) [Fructobacillus fructosus]